ncbi:hypothetical protein [Nonomuraea helvata]|uniref:Uncharacterized protein n=1 Tax=Nonomuraea helvata TaxID=37484 RepID=A0ABV5RSY9_9ACTN
MSNFQPDRRTGTGLIWSAFKPGCAHTLGLAGMAGNVMGLGPVSSFSIFPYPAGGLVVGLAVGDPVGFGVGCAAGPGAVGCSAAEQPQTMSAIATSNRFTPFMIHAR